MAKRFTYYGNDFAYDVNALAFINAAGITGTLQKSVLNTYVLMLKGIGTTFGSSLFNKIYANYRYCPINETTATATAYSYNLINPATFQIGWTGFVSGDFTPTGVIGGAGKYGDTGLNQLVDITTLSHGIDVYIRTQNTLTEVELGARRNAGTFDGGEIAPYITGNDYSYMNKLTLTAAQVVRTGLMSVDYDGVNVNKYRNGVSFFTVAQTPGTPRNINYTAHALNNLGVITAFSTKSIGGITIRQPFTINEMSDLYEAELYYQSNIIIGGRNV